MLRMATSNKKNMPKIILETREWMSSKTIPKILRITTVRGSIYNTLIFFNNGHFIFRKLKYSFKKCNKRTRQSSILPRLTIIPKLFKIPEAPKLTYANDTVNINNINKSNNGVFLCLKYKYNEIIKVKKK